MIRFCFKTNPNYSKGIAIAFSDAKHSWLLAAAQGGQIASGGQTGRPAAFGANPTVESLVTGKAPCDQGQVFPSGGAAL